MQCAVIVIADVTRDRSGFMRIPQALEPSREDRYKLSKQADVLMLFYLFSAEES